MRKIIAVGVATLAVLAAADGTAAAQSRTPPDTSVKALEAPVDVRRQQLNQQTPSATTAGTATRAPSGAAAPVVATPPR